MTYSYPQHRFEATVNARRMLGLIMVVLVHVMAILAISKGTAIVDMIRKHDMRVTVITPEVLIPPSGPVEVSSKTGVGLKIDPTPPVINTETKETRTGTEATKPSTGESTAGVAAQAARLDPRYPLTQPAYPAQSRRMGEQGRVELFVYVLPSGKIGEARISQSCGYPRLDDAALKEALRNWRLLPNEVNGTPIGSWVTLAITFRLTQ